MSTYYPNGRITPVGEMFRQPNLARDAARDVEGRQAGARAAARPREQAIQAGRDAFYSGPRARDRRRRSRRPAA